MEFVPGRRAGVVFVISMSEPRVDYVVPSARVGPASTRVIAWPFCKPGATLPERQRRCAEAPGVSAVTGRERGDHGKDRLSSVSRGGDGGGGAVPKA